jgi:hypothetical protein
MMAVELTTQQRPDATHHVIVQAVTVIMGTVVALTFLFGFGNVLTLALRLGVPAWVAPLVAPAVDLSILGLLAGTRHLALHGATPEQLRPARRLLIFANVATLALNIAEPILAGDFGKAAFDAVGPLLLIGWAEVGPGLLQAIAAISHQPAKAVRAETCGRRDKTDDVTATTAASSLKTGCRSEAPLGIATDRSGPVVADSDLVSCV